MQPDAQELEKTRENGLANVKAFSPVTAPSKTFRSQQHPLGVIVIGSAMAIRCTLSRCSLDGPPHDALEFV
jgi:hypothetical protein